MIYQYWNILYESYENQVLRYKDHKVLFTWHIYSIHSTKDFYQIMLESLNNVWPQLQLIKPIQHDHLP